MFKGTVGKDCFAPYIGVAVFAFFILAGILLIGQPAMAAQGDTTAIHILDTDANGSCDTLRLYIDNTNGTTWSAGTSGSSLQSWQDTGFDGLKGDGNDYFFMGRTVNGISFNSLTNANPIIIDVGLVEGELGKNTDLNGFHHIEYLYAPVGIGNGGIEDGVNELNTINVFDSGANDTEIDKAPPIIRAFTYQDTDNDGKIDAIFVELTEGVAAGSVLRPNDLIFTNVGDFTGVAWGAGTTNSFGSPGIVGSSMQLGTEATVIDTFDDSGNMAISTQNSFSLVDSDANVNNTLGAQPQAINGDSARPYLLSFTSTNPDATYGPGASINITATYSENLGAGATLTAVFNTGKTATLNTVSGTTVYTNYIVGGTGSGSDTSDLTVAVIPSESVPDIYTYNVMGTANIQTASSIPGSPNNIADTSNIVVDTTAPSNTSVGTSTPLGMTVNEADAGAGTVLIIFAEFSESMSTTTIPVFTMVDDFANSPTGLVFTSSTWGTTGANPNDRYEEAYSLVDNDEYLYNIDFQVTGAADAVGNVQGAGLLHPDSLSIDTQKPVVNTITPVDSSTGVSITTPIVINFNEPMDTVTGVTYTVGGGADPGGWAESWNIAGDTVTLSHSNFAYSTSYTFTLTNALDAAGNGIAASTSTTFTTGSAPPSGGGGHLPPDTTPPAAPTNVMLTADSSGNLVMTWDDPLDSDCDFIDIQRDHLPTAGIIPDSIYVKVPKGVERFDEGGLIPGETYIYRVRAEDTSDNMSTNMEEYSITIPTGEGMIAEGEGEEASVELVLEDPTPAGPLPEGVEVGELVKRTDISSVYFIDQDNRRHAFPNEATYFSWFADFSGVRTISAEALAAIPLGSNVTVRPGTHLIKIATDPKTYAVEPYGVIRWIETEELAEDLYGSDWNTQIIDVDVSFFANYQPGPSIGGAEHPTGSVLQYTGETARYYVEEGLKRLISSEIFGSNFLQERFVITDFLSSITYDLGEALPALSIDELIALP